MSLGALCGINFMHNDVRLARQHVCSCALAGVADVGISLHAAHHRMRRYGNMDHGRPTLRADCLGIDCVSKGHSVTPNSPPRAYSQFRRRNPDKLG